MYYLITDEYLFRRKLSIMAGILSLSLFSTFLYAQSKPKVEVQFNILYPLYIEAYEDDLDFISSETFKMLKSLLNKNYPFIQFDSSSTSYLLSITLDKDPNEHSLSTIGPTKFRMFLIPKNGEAPDSMDITFFRDAGQATAGLPGDKEGFLAEIIPTLADGMNNIKIQIVTDILSHVKICDNVLLLPTKRWVIPFSRNELKIDNGSEFQLNSTVPDPDVTSRNCIFSTIVLGDAGTTITPALYRSKIVCEIKDPANSNQPCFEKIPNATLTGVYLKKFIPYSMSVLTP